MPLGLSMDYWEELKATKICFRKFYGKDWKYKEQLWEQDQRIIKRNWLKILII